MKIVVKTDGKTIRVPVPLGLAGGIISLLPDAAFRQMRENTPEPYRQYVSKPFITFLCNECLGSLKECKGLEIVHVEAADGTYVSIKV